MSQRLRLGPWLVFPDSNEIVSGDESVKVEPRVMRVLVHLARHSNEVVPREQILKAVWDGVFVSDEVLTNAIREARKALGDDAKEPEFIQTIPKQGYRLLASVSWEEVEETPPTKPVRFERPYPGLAPFSEDEAEFFFGREEEVEAVWGKLNRFHLLGLFGPSGAGKSSFVRAGLMPARPEGWRAVICHPGEKPFLALAHALVPEFAGDTEATRELLRLDESDTALSLLEQWRKKHPEVLLCIDQFEELFTLNRQDVQTRFAELVGRLGQELGIHILLAIRDDFLIHCDHHPMLSPIFKELTPLNPPRGAALRRALVEPAKRCGYHFDDESLVTEMLSEVTKERGALPLLAFAAARLWEKRDRDRRVLTRTAYLETGGVAGALAQHAEATLERVGNDRIPMVRELFRNLVTAQGTRAARDKEEILSVFEDREAAARVLHELIDARLLTTFESPGLEGEESSPARGDHPRVSSDRVAKTGSLADAGCGQRAASRSASAGGTHVAGAGSSRRSSLDRDIVQGIPGLARELPGRSHHRRKKLLLLRWCSMRSGGEGEGALWPSPVSDCCSRWSRSSVPFGNVP